MSTDSTILQLLSAGSTTSTAIAAPSVRPLTYGELRDQVKCTVETLNGYGVGRNDRVAIVLPNGPEMATAFVGIAAGASAAPLNPVYRIEEFEFYLSDLVRRPWSWSKAVNRQRDRSLCVWESWCWS